MPKNYKYDVTVDPAGPYHFADQVSVTTNAPAEDRPWIEMACRNEAGEVIGSANHAGFPGGAYYGVPFQFGPTMSWEKGGAVCTFTVVHVSGKQGHQTTDAETEVTVEA